MLSDGGFGFKPEMFIEGLKYMGLGMLGIFIVVAILIGLAMGSLELGLVINLVMNIIIGVVTFIIYPTMLHEGIS
jgi:hypothetical protein